MLLGIGWRNHTRNVLGFDEGMGDIGTTGWIDDGPRGDGRGITDDWQDVGVFAPNDCPDGRPHIECAQKSIVGVEL